MVAKNLAGKFFFQLSDNSRLCLFMAVRLQVAGDTAGRDWKRHRVFRRALRRPGEGDRHWRARWPVYFVRPQREYFCVRFTSCASVHNSHKLCAQPKFHQISCNWTVVLLVDLYLEARNTF